MHVYYNPLDIACKNVIGAIKSGETLTLNIFLLKEPKRKHRGEGLNIKFLTSPKEEECAPPTQNGVLLLNKDGEPAGSYPLVKTSFGWTISLKINQIGLYYYTFSIENEG